MPQIVKGTRSTPEISLNPITNEWAISGRSYSLEAYNVFHPVLDWLSTCEQRKIKRCTFSFKLLYFNTTSFKIIFDILQILKTLSKKGVINPKIKWYYDAEDEDMLETGQNLKSTSELPFELIINKP